LGIKFQDQRTRGAQRFHPGLRLLTAQLLVASLALLASPALAGTAQNPMFVAPGLVVNPVNANASPIFVDIDMDGDLDAFVGANDGTTSYYANTGTATNPMYALPMVSPFGLLDVGNDAAPDFVDIDDDGDLDALVGNSTGDVWYQPNTGTAMAPAFGALVINPFGILNSTSFASPYFVDIDGDTDLDVVIGNGAGDLRYQQNGGSTVLAAYGAVAINPFGLANVVTRAAPVFADLDNDGDFDALVGDGNGTSTYFQNDGTNVAPNYAVTPPLLNPLGLSDVGLNASPDLADIDGDGDLDALIGEGGGNTIFFENEGSVTMPMFAGSLAVDVGAWSVPTFGDLDGDGDLDAIVGASGAEHFYFQNTGSASSPSFAASVMNPFGLVNVPGSESAPDLVDYDGDGDLDVVTGNLTGDAYLYTNVGGPLAPAFAAPVINPNGLINVQMGGIFGGSTPDFVDIDADMDLDAFIGNGSGDTYYFQNTGTAMVPAYAAPIMNAFGLANSGGSFAAPEFVDIDVDGDFDAMIGGGDGNTHVYLNVGLPGAPTFGSANVSPFGLVDVGFEASPAFPDIDNDGDFDAFIGSTAGTTLFFENLAIDVPPGAVCGNNIVEAPETCDDGNTTSGDGCSEICQIELTGVCGDGTLNRPAEECDDGNVVAGDGCDATCMHEMCGDGVVDPLEECDDGNTVLLDGCDNSCFIEAVCGDGVVQGGEECDDGNTIDDDSCNNMCMLAPEAAIQGEIKTVKIGLKFNKTSKDKIDINIKNWTLPQGLVPTDVAVNLGGTELTGTLDVKGKYKSLDKRDKMQMKQSKKSGLWKLTVKRKNNDFAASLADEGLTDADNPKPGMPVTVHMSVTVGGQAYGQDMNLIYKSKLGKKGSAK
jgi:cysteine-rich repeat protein